MAEPGSQSTRSELFAESDAPPGDPGTRVDAILRHAAHVLAGLPDGAPRLEAELLLSEATGRSRTSLIAWPEHRVEPEVREVFAALLARRLAGEPIAYIRGRQSFWSIELRVTGATLIPRPETELLVEVTLEHLAASQPLRVADLGTGSGAIAAALATEHPNWHVVATERSAAAIQIAAENLRRLGLERVALVRGHWLDACAPASLDAVVSNPPYVAEGDPHLMSGDLRFEPREALTPGGDGLDAYRSIVADARRCLRPGGWVILEHGYDQGAEVRRILSEAGLTAPRTRPDLAGHDRVTVARR
jgi:release factor glutamine methyltransferase